MAVNQSIRLCTIDGCKRKHYAKGICHLHYNRVRRTGSTDDPAPTKRRLCSFDGCGRGHDSRGLCIQHANQMRQHGVLKAISPARMGTRAQHLDFYTDKTGECWLWTGSLSTDGYGQVRLDGALTGAHRAAYELCVGPIGDGLMIDHICHNRHCVNPDHLQAVTRKENGENRAGVTAANKSGVRGVHWSEAVRKWRAQVGHLGTTVHVGDFDDLASAETAVIKARNQLFSNNLLDRR